jgi:RHS repeat-associated protein
VTALNPNGSTVLFGSYLGGNGGSNDFASGVALDPNDNIYVVGATQSSNFPTTSGGFQTSLDGTTDGFVAKFTSLSIPSVITSANNVTFIAGSLGSFTVTASGIPGPILSESGSLPSGVTFNTGTGVLSGTPASGTGGSYSITFTASNGVNPNATQNFTLTVDQAPTITSTNTTTFTVGTAGTFTVAATGNPTPTLSESGALPSGVTFTAATGVLAGTPAAGTNGTYPITFTASDGVGSNATQNFTLTVNNAPLPTITSVSRTSGPYGAQVTITGTNFGASQGSSIVAFNGFVAATVSGGWNATTIVALVPFDSSIGNITVTVYGQTATGPTFSIISVATLTDSLGNSSTYNGGQVAGEWHVTSAQGSGCSSCTVRGVNQYAYDAFGNVTSMTDPAGHVTTYTYDSSNDMLTESTKLNSTTTATTTYTYNSFGEPLTVTDPLGNVTMNTYDSHGNLTSVTTPKPDSNTAASVTQFAYNSLGELTTITDPLSHLTTMTYTPAGLIATIKDAQNNITTYGYDSQGNRTSVTDALNHQTTFAYDAMSRLKTITYPDSTSSTTTFAYDSRGRRTSVTDQNGKTTNYAYDDADRLTSVTDAAQHTTYYAYDTEGNLTKITDANSNQTAFTYDAFGRVTLTNFPSSLSENYQYDADNNLTSKTDRKNQTITYVYDALNRLAKKQYPDSTEVDYVYDLVGKIQQVNDPTGTYALAYDSMGRLIGTTTNYSFLTSRSFTNAYTYDAASNRTGFTDPESGSTTYTYDTLNRLTSLAPPSAFGSGSFGFSYDALSRRTQMARPNRVTTNYAYDNLSRLQSVLHQLSGSTIDGASYTLDSAGNRTARTDQRAAVTSNYTYDAIYQLTQVTQANNTTESYTYDPVGNRTASLGVSSYTTNASNELTATSNATYTYDSNGNTLTKTVGSNTTTYAWDFENRLTSVTLPGTGGTVTFKYDPLGRRIEKVSPTFTSVFAYDSASLTEETNASGVVVARYAQGSGIDEPLAEVGSGATSYYEQDGLDSVTSLTNPTGALAQTYTLDSFGKLTSSSGLLTNSFQYTGRESDPETGLYYYRARYYDPQTGRFLNEDPTGFTGGIDLYSYVSNAPTILRDPTGNNGAIVVVGGGAVSVTTTITVTMIGSSAGSAPVLSLIAGGSGGGATAGPIGALVGVIAVVGTYDAIQLHKLCEAYGLCGPDNKPSPPPCNTGRQSKCVPIGYDKQLGGCRYLCDDGRVWFEAGPCKGVTFKPWGDGFPKYPPTPLAP